MSLAFVVKEGEFYCHIFLNSEICVNKKVYVIPSQREITERGRIVLILCCIVRLRLVFKFHSTMTCCVAINAKEGNYWIVLSLMSYQSLDLVY